MDNKQIIENAYKSFETGDIPALLGTFDENIEWTEAEGFPYGGTYTGANAILENVFMKLGTEWENFAAVPDEILDAGDNIVALGNYSGKYNASGQKYESAVRARLDSARRQDRQICSIHGYIKSFRGFVMKFKENRAGKFLKNYLVCLSK